MDRLGRVHRTVHGGNVLERVVTTCEEMLRDRGCAEVVRTPDLATAVENGRPLLCGREAPSGGGFDVYVHSEDRVGVKFARAVREACEKQGCEAVVVSVDGPTPFTRKECGDSIQFFGVRELCYNVTRHALVPKHVPVGEPPPGTTRETLPRMLDTDPVAQYYRWPLGTVVRVDRCFGGHEPIPYFRVVVADRG